MTKEKSFMTNLMTCSINKMRIRHFFQISNFFASIGF